MKKLLYLSHVSWDWTKQRPQFIAEGLSKYYDVLYVQDSSIWKRKRKRNKNEIVRYKDLWCFPFGRFRVVRFLSCLIHKIQLYSLCRKADVIWFTSPGVFEWIDVNFFSNKMTVYDCMDDMVELYPYNNEMRDNEEKIYKKAGIVISSSYHLANKLKQRYGQREIQIVNNAISSDFDNITNTLPSDYIQYFKRGKIIITYVGSISSWMDFDLLIAILDKFPMITINLWGPIHDVNILEHRGINFCGVVEHKYVSSILSASDILIMPFVVNELIESVNPVKLYEYIFSGKPCLAPKYGESLQFGDYVNLYDSHGDCLAKIKMILDGEHRQKTLMDCRKFVQNNTWENRVMVIYRAINREYTH